MGISAGTIRRFLNPVAAALLLVPLFFGGCGLTSPQRAAVARFGAAAADLGAIAGEEFRQSRFDVIAMNTSRRGLGDRTVDPAKLDGYFTLADVTARADAAAALRSYGVLLASLAGGAESAELSVAAERFVGSLGRLKTAARIDITDERLGAIGRAVAGVGGLAIEAERARAIREVVETSAPAVRRVAELIRRDFDATEDHWALGYLVVAAKLEEVVQNTRSDLGAVGGGGDGGGRRISTGAVLAEAEALRGQCVARFEEIGPRIVEAAEAVTSAERQMRVTLVNGGVALDDVDAAADQVAELIRVYRVLRP